MDSMVACYNLSAPMHI